MSDNMNASAERGESPSLLDQKTNSHCHEQASLFRSFSNNEQQGYLFSFSKIRVKSLGSELSCWSRGLCEFDFEGGQIKLARVETRHTDHETNKNKLRPPEVPVEMLQKYSGGRGAVLPKARGEKHREHAKDKVNAHVNCFLGKRVERSEDGLRIASK